MNSIHHAELLPSEAGKLINSTVIFYLDRRIENFIAPYKEKAKEVSLALKLLPMRDHHIFADLKDGSSRQDDLHFWLDPTNAKSIVRYISQIMQEYDPVNEAKYELNSEHIINKIEEAESYIFKLLNSVRDYPYIVLHDAYQYFERYFALNPVAALSLANEEEAGAKTTARIHSLVQEKNINCFAAESAHNKVFGRPVTVIDPLGLNLEVNQDLYVNLIKGIAESFYRCLSFRVDLGSLVENSLSN